MSWTLRSLVAAAGIPADVSGDAELSGVAYDSRTVEPGDLFCCFPGSRADGHDFAPRAVEAGAAALLVERPLDAGVPQARVDSVRRALGPLSHHFFGRPSEAMDVAGVTGTNGKTTVTYLVEAMAAAAGRTPAVIGTIESRLGGEAMPASRSTPESVDLQRLLARMRDRGADVVAMEVTSHGLDQGRVSGTRFACAAFTNLSQDHLDYHGTLDDYFEAKATLFGSEYTNRAVVNTHDPHGRQLLERIGGLDVLTYAGAGADIVPETVEMGASLTRTDIATPRGSVRVTTPLVGSYNVENVLCATGVALQIGLPLDAVAQGAANVRVDFGRLEPVDAGQPFTVLVDYAHTPDALRRALEASRDLTAGRLIVVFGCGGDRDRGKRPLMGEAATRLADLAIVTSDNPRSEDPAAIISDIVPGAERGGGSYRVQPDRREAIGEAFEEAGPGDVVLIAGKGHEQGQEFADRTIPFDDRQVARELLEEGVGCRG